MDFRSFRLDADVIYNDAHNGKRPSDLIAAENAFADYSESLKTTVSSKRRVMKELSKNPVFNFQILPAQILHIYPVLAES